MLEWLKRHAWKACIRQNRISGSNPDLSARKSRTPRPGIFFRQNSSSLYASYASSGRVWSTESFRSAAVGRYFWCPPAAVLQVFRARRQFENTIGHTFAGKSRPSEAILYIHRPRLRYQHGFSVDAITLPITLPYTPKPREKKSNHLKIR